MKRIISIILMFFALFFLFNDAEAASNSDQSQQIQILSAADSLFVFMKNKNYKTIWSVLSKKSQATIVNDVRKEYKKSGLEKSNEELFNDFMSGGYNAKAYWDNFLSVFNPDIVLERCEWKIGEIEKDKAEIILQYRKSEKPAILKMFKEDSEWKVGLDESFGARKFLPF